MFVEDVELIRRDSLKELLDRCIGDPRRFPHEVEDLWRDMDRGDFSIAVGAKLLRFNGKLFKSAGALPLTLAEIRLLRTAAAADWRDLEPAIFGTLFERALDPAERKRLGAHYTPRAYVERLVNATIMDPLLEDWAAAQTAADLALRAGTQSVAVKELQDFLVYLSRVRVLDPSCGTGNFLYVALRQMKLLEGEVLKYLQDVGGEDAVAAMGRVSIRPEQFFGMELNQSAVEIAELVLWIGYLQWHLRSRATPPEEPILGSGDHVTAKDAVLNWEGYPGLELQRSSIGLPIRKRRANGEIVEVRTYPKPRRPDWPQADFIVGNPPFIGGKDLRGRMSDEYVEALWKAHPHINRSADYVMYWWDRAAELLTVKGTRLRRFGLVTTNSITQTFQSRLVERRLNGPSPVSIVVAIPDHPWTTATKDAAAVRIAMTVVAPGKQNGVLSEVVSEHALDTDEPALQFHVSRGRINADLTVGTDVTKGRPALANDGICSPGVKLHGDGFIVTKEAAIRLGLGKRPGLERHIRDYRNGRDLTSHSRGHLVIDLFGLNEGQVRAQYPEVYEHLLETVKPERDHNSRASYREKWWVFGEPRRELRSALKDLARYIATVETSKSRTFQFLPSTILPDNMLVTIASDDAYVLGVLSSRLHVAWSVRSGGWLGVGNDPRYTKSRCFDPFPFPETSEAQKEKIRAVAEELDRIRRNVLIEHSDITLTALYNVVEALRTDTPLTSKQEQIKSRGRVLTLMHLHQQIDAAVAHAFGWPVDVSDEQLFDALLKLNAQRLEEERGGFIRWLRPEYQISKFGPLAHRADRVQSISISRRRKVDVSFGREAKEQARQVLDIVRSTRRPFSANDVALHFRDRERVVRDVREVLESLLRVGQVETFDNGRTFLSATV
jgi:hypothetical protein